MKILIEISARHLHLCNKDIEKLFGRGYQLKPLKNLSQPGEFAAQETVDLVTKKGILKNVRVIGPARKNTQVEITYTEARQLGIRGVLRLSGNTKNTPGITIVGLKGNVKISSGVIIAKRHIHVSSQRAKKLGLKNNQKVSVMVGGNRSAVLNRVVVRVAPNFKWHFHIDTDEANAVGATSIKMRGMVLLAASDDRKTEK